MCPCLFCNLLSVLLQVITVPGSGIMVSFDGKHIMKIVVPGTLRGGLCGLCGDFNGVKEDDWSVGPRFKSLAGTLVSLMHKLLTNIQLLFAK